LKSNNKKGFTLVEVIISTAIVAVVALIALASLRFALGVWDRGAEAAEEAAVKRYFSGEFRRLVASAYPCEDEDGEILFHGEESSLSFVSAGRTASTGMPWGGVRLLEYSMDEGRLFLKEAQVPYAPFAAARPSLITACAERVEFSYLGLSGWERAWDAAEEKRLPKAIRAAVYLSNKKKPLIFEAGINTGKGEQEAR